MFSMSFPLEESSEQKSFRVLEHWKSPREILPAEQLLDTQNPAFPLFSYLYAKTEELYTRLPTRKNGEISFIHPSSVVFFLRKAKISDEAVLCAGLLHDFIEEKVDLWMYETGSSLTAVELEKAAAGEEKLFQTAESEITGFCARKGLSQFPTADLIFMLRLLTRHKQHSYFDYISKILNCSPTAIKERVLVVKLADRIHNILNIEHFTEQQRLYQCFKNLFILNNVKKYLLETYGEEKFLNMKFTPIERLFNKCCKATYEAFLRVCHLCNQKGITEATPLLQMTFKKYAMATSGLWEVTSVDIKEVHPTRLYQGIVHKYEARLLHHSAEFDTAWQQEQEYCRSFFQSCHFTEEQLKALIDYKDA